MHTATVAQFEIAAHDPEALKRFYASLFGWRLLSQDSGAPTAYAISAQRAGIEGAISYADQGGVHIVIAVDDVLETSAAQKN